MRVSILISDNGFGARLRVGLVATNGAPNIYRRAPMEAERRRNDGQRWANTALNNCVGRRGANKAMN